MSLKIEKSEDNPHLIEEILKLDFMTNYWKSTTHTPYVLTTVDKNSVEYLRVENVFKMTARSLKMIKLQRVENPYLLGIYLLKKEKKQTKSFVHEEQLFHGTRLTHIDSICRNNFDWRRSGTSRGHKFGRGVSFTPEVSYAWHYGISVMILSKVLVQHKTIGNIFTVVPPEPYDTTTNGRNTVYVKYDDDEFYPQYVIHYSY